MAVATSRPPALRRPRRGNTAGELSQKVWVTAVLWLLVAVYGIPVAWFLLSSMKSPGERLSFPLTVLPKDPTFDGFTQAWTSFDFAQYFLNTMIVASAATVLTIVASAMAGYALAKYN